jgi:hypothetical protein
VAEVGHVHTICPGLHHRRKPGRIT